jgi:hypothetical protein
MMKAKWYRNPPEKDQDKPQGTGEIIHFGLLERTGEGVVVIVDDEGNIVEKPFSLVRIIKDEPEPNTPPETKAFVAKATVPTNKTLPKQK